MGEANNSHEDNDLHKGAVEQDRPGQENNVAPLTEQLDHRNQESLNKLSDTNFPEPGQNEEHSREPREKSQLDDTYNPEGLVQDQDPGHRQKQNQNDNPDDDLAA